MTTEKKAVRDWRRRVRAFLRDLDVPGDGYPTDAVRGLLALGVQRVSIDAALGGEGLGLRGAAAVLEELATYDGSLGAAVMGIYSANAFVTLGATPEQRRTWLDPLLAGEGVAAVAVTEPQAGTDLGALATTCRQAGDGRWRLDGRKAFISNTGHELWRLTIVLAQGPEAKGHTAFLVPPDTPGFAVDRARSTIGWSRVGVHDLTLDGVVVPDAQRLGPPGQGLRLALAAFDRGRVAVAALACGLCRAAFEDADAYTRRRETFGAPLVDHDAVADHLVTLWRLYTRARLVTGEAADVGDAGLPLGVWAAVAKLEATSAAVQAARLGVQILGSRGLLRDGRAAARWGDAKTLEVVEGTTEVQALVLRRQLRKGGLPLDPWCEGSDARHACAFP